MLTESDHSSDVSHPGRKEFNSRQHIEEKVGSSHKFGAGCQVDFTPTRTMASRLDVAPDAMFKDVASHPDCRNNFMDHPSSHGQEDKEAYKLSLITAPENEYIEQPPVNRQLKEEIYRILEKFGVQNINAFVENSSINILYGIRSLEEACYSKGLG